MDSGAGITLHCMLDSCCSQGAQPALLYRAWLPHSPGKEPTRPPTYPCMCPTLQVPPLIVRGPGAGSQNTATGVFADLITLARYLGAPS